MSIHQIVKRVLKEEFEKQEVIEIPSLKIFGKHNGVAWIRLQEFLEKRGNPPYTISGDLNLRETPIKSLGNLISVVGYLDLLRTRIESLGNLTSVGVDLDLRYTPIESLGNLTSVGGYLDLYDTPLSKMYTKKQIREMVNVGGNIYIIISDLL